jgi:hypothetical protein
MRGDAGPLVIGGVLFASVLVAFIYQHRLNEQLRREVDELRSLLGQPVAARSPGASGPVSGAPATDPAAATELRRLREEVNELRARTAALAHPLGKEPAGSPPLNLRPASAWRQAGKGTPSAAAESLFWAADGGDVETLAKSILLDADARAQAEAILARLPPESRAAYDSPEKLIALLLAREIDVKALQILGENQAGDDALVNLRMQKDDGKTKEEGYPFKRTSDGWRLVIPAKAVDKFGKKLSDPGKKK